MQSTRFLLAIAMAVGMVAPSETSLSPRKEDQDKELLEAIRDLGLDAEVRYFSTYADLNGDGRKEAIVYLIGPHICGSGGCHTVIFSRQKKGYKQIADIELTRPPIVAAKSKTKGWRDLIVFVQGGGILEGYNMLLPFDGASYPGSPFLKPAHPFQRKIRGDVLIAHHSYEEGKSLTQP